jgi:hypothetical protein
MEDAKETAKEMLKEPVVFTGKLPGMDKELCYVYDADNLTALQCELAREVSLFKNDQQQNKVNVSFKDMIKTGGATWLTKCMSYLLNEKSDNKILPFTIESAEKAEFFLQHGLKGAGQIRRMEECIDDFFTNIGTNWTVSTLLRNKKELSGNDLVLSLMSNPLMWQMMSANGLSKNKSE